MVNGAALITCHNRKMLTLRCLKGIYSQINAIPDCRLAIYLVDDGSTDGTLDAVKQLYPEVITLTGNGQLYWNGGMQIAWQKALSDTDYDFFLWINDDINLSNDAIPRLIECYCDLSTRSKDIGAITGTMVDPISKQPTYGGRNPTNKLNPLKLGDVIPPQNQIQPCTIINGNLSLITNTAVKTIGTLSNIYTHGLGDFDYSFRLRQAGLKVWIAPGIFGECPHNSPKGTWRDASLPVKTRLSLLKRPNQIAPEKEFLTFVRLHGGKFWFLLWFKIWLQWRLPILWLISR